MRALLRNVFWVVWLALLLPSFAWAQTGTIEGTVSDGEDGGPLPGATVQVVGTNMGTATDPEGAFTLDGVETGRQQLRVSFVGYQMAERSLRVRDGETTTVSITLRPQRAEMDEVVVTAMGQKRTARAVATSVQQVSGADLAQVEDDNFLSSLQGRVAGATISSSSTMGGSTNINIRGISSISGNNQPLIVIDGIVIDNNTNRSAGRQGEGLGGIDFGNAAQSINPNEVQSISVLKGPSAAALYGSRGANGVIEITTKDGRGEDGIGVSFSSSVRGTRAYEFMDYQNSYGGGAPNPFQTVSGGFQIADSEDELVADFATDESWGPPLDGRQVRQWYSFDDVNNLEGDATAWEAHPDNVRNFLNTGTTFENNLALSKGAEDYSYRLSLVSQNTNGVMPNSSLDRYQFNLNAAADLTDRLTVTGVARYSYEQATGRTGTGYFCQVDGCTPGTNPFAQFNTFGQRQYDLGEDSFMRDYERPNGQQRGWNFLGVEGARNGTFNFTDNPYVARYENVPNDDTQRLFGKVDLAYEFTDAFSSSFMVTNDNYTERRGARVTEISVEDPARFREDVFEVQEINSELRLNYTQQINEDFELTSFAAGRVRWETFDYIQQQTSNGLSAPGVFNIENSVGRPAIVDSLAEKQVYSVYGSANVGYRDFVFLEATLRNDWSSSLPADNNSYLYPSISANIIFTELAIFENQDVLSFGKLRASWAQVGDDTRAYQLASTFPVNTPFAGQPLQEINRDSNNPALEPERKTGVEVGTDLRFLNERVNLSATVYRETTRDQIVRVDVSPTSGVNTALVNAGSIRNEGVETQLRVTPVLTQDLQWNVTVNWATNRNEVIELTDGVSSLTLGSAPFGPDIVARVGEPYGAMEGPALVRDANGDIVFDRQGNPQVTSDTRVIGNYLPDWTGGIGTTLNYKRLTVSALINGQQGGNVWSLSNLFGLFSGLTEETVANRQRETGVIPDGVVLPDGVSNENAGETEGIPFAEADGAPDRIAAPSFWKSFFGADDAFVYDATYWKLQEVALSYRIPQQWLGQVPVQRAQVTLTGSNLLTLYKEAPNIDPSVTLGAGNVQGIEAAQIPPRRTIGFRVNLQF